jgi:hypothetical protein
MSEPVSNVEIEDVLSSIRRLVSEDNRPLRHPEPTDTPYKPSRLVLTPSLLVVDSTPATDEPESLYAVEMAHDDADTAPELEFHKGNDGDQGTDLPAEQPVDASAVSEAEQSQVETSSQPTLDLDTEVAVDENMDLRDSISGEEDELIWATSKTPWIDPKVTLYEAAEAIDIDEDISEDDTDNSVDASVDTSVDTSDVPPVDISSGGPDAVEASADEDTEAQGDESNTPVDLSDAVASEKAAAADLDWPEVQDTSAEADEALLEEPIEEPFGDHQEKNASFDEDALDDHMSDDEHPVEVSAENQPTVSDNSDDLAGADHSNDDPEGGDPEGDEETQRTITLGAKIAALEAKIGQTQDQWEPDGELGDDYAGTHGETIEWQDHEGETAAVPDQVPPFVDKAPDASDDIPEADVAPDVRSGDDMLDDMNDDAAILDEESLRELVADIVRQELQGALGERITRNVRKLVRREIHRALTAQELE